MSATEARGGEIFIWACRLLQALPFVGSVEFFSPSSRRSSGLTQINTVSLAEILSERHGGPSRVPGSWRVIFHSYCVSHAAGFVTGRVPRWVTLTSRLFTSKSRSESVMGGYSAVAQPAFCAGPANSLPTPTGGASPFLPGT